MKIYMWKWLTGGQILEGIGKSVGFSNVPGRNGEDSQGTAVQDGALG